MHFKEDVVVNKFSHIYIEEEIKDSAMTKKITSFFPHASKIIIHDYRDVFNRKKQSHALQKSSQNLILAKKKNDFLYSASPVCQSFDYANFYYTTTMMNCIYDCEYCFLKGMYPSGNLVIFVNIEDFLNEIENRLKEHSIYLCVSYDTDMLALEPITQYAKILSEFTEKHPSLCIEIRTKGTYSQDWKNVCVSERVILAFTLSPEYVISHYEHGTPALTKRIAMIQEAMALGYPVRLCFDPIIAFQGYEKEYLEMVRLVKESIDLKRVKDISIGSFRISKNYLKDMRKQYPSSSVLQYPYVCDHGFYHLRDDIQEKVEHTLLDALEEVKDKIYQWENE